ncbi:hypothetical protein BDV39DRAFT_165604 [Aspergillus sergii]|uniref:Uncharacterized protein n=1 Tax=Aspergillus sergii TaxID=1034303 RepID=A0A5N6XJ71_9EURO|nr:hypothetical protein BDV39DRAFT_165604 [Aspergillus sergii]
MILGCLGRGSSLMSVRPERACATTFLLLGVCILAVLGCPQLCNCFILGQYSSTGACWPMTHFVGIHKAYIVFSIIGVYDIGELGCIPDGLSGIQLQDIWFCASMRRVNNSMVRINQISMASEQPGVFMKK